MRATIDGRRPALSRISASGALRKVYPGLSRRWLEVAWVALVALAGCRGDVPSTAAPDPTTSASMTMAAPTPRPPHPRMTPRWLTPPPEADPLAIARETLVAFFDHLHSGRYAEAAELYDGPYTTYEQWNPDIAPGERARLWEAVCTKQVPCLAVSRVLDGRAMGPDTFLFTVAFVRADGSLFSLGPCCGSSAGPITWQFPVTVVRRQGRFAVMTGPVHGR